MSDQTKDTKTQTLTLTRTKQRKSNATKVREQMTALIGATVNKSVTTKGYGITLGEWSVTTLSEDPASYLDTHTLTLDVGINGKPADLEEVGKLVYGLAKRSETPKFGHWTLVTIDGQPYSMPQPGEIKLADTKLVGYADVSIPEDFDDYFSHLYGLGHQVARVREALESAIDSDWENRFHVGLYGKPGCGKSDILKSLQRALGRDAVRIYDATATTSAGAIKELVELEELPRVIGLEEIEKAPEAAMQFLLGVMDLRGEVKKLTARQDVQRNTNVLVIATANNVAKLKALQAGALYSRLVNRIYFPRPDRDTLAMICARELTKVKGNPATINPALDYCQDHDVDDPRTMIALCLQGKDGWLDGSYAERLNATSEYGITQDDSEEDEWTDA